MSLICKKLIITDATLLFDPGGEIKLEDVLKEISWNLELGL